MKHKISSANYFLRGRGRAFFTFHRVPSEKSKPFPPPPKKINWLRRWVENVTQLNLQYLILCELRNQKSWWSCKMKILFRNNLLLNAIWMSNYKIVDIYEWWVISSNSVAISSELSVEPTIAPLLTDQKVSIACGGL